MTIIQKTVQEIRGGTGRSETGRVLVSQKPAESSVSAKRHRIEASLGRSSREKPLICGNNGKYGKYGIGLKRFHGNELTGPMNQVRNFNSKACPS
jgi:hypothetical protein